jgi:phage head maturation protease
MNEGLVKFVSARQWAKTVKEYNAPDPDGMEVAPPDLGVRLGFNADVEVLGKGTKPKPEGRQILIAISSETVDRDTDTIAVDGWDLKQYRKNPVVLFGHRYFETAAPVVGKSLTEFVDKGKLKSLLEFTPQGMVPLADTLYGLYAEGFMNASSVGFIPKEWKFPEDDPDRPWGIDFLKQELIEYSLVPVPSNPDALVEARSKGIATEPIKEWTEEVLDAWAANKSSNLWIPKSMLKKLRDAADPKQPTSAQVLDAATAAFLDGVPHEQFTDGEPDPIDAAISGDAEALRTLALPMIRTETGALPISVEAAEALGVLEEATAFGDQIRAAMSRDFATATDIEFTRGDGTAGAATITTGEPELDETGATPAEAAHEARQPVQLGGESTEPEPEPEPEPAVEPAAAPAPEPEPEIPAEEVGVDGEMIELSDDACDALDELGIDLDALEATDDGESVAADGTASAGCSAAEIAEILAEIIGEDVEAALTQPLGGSNDA